VKGVAQDVRRSGGLEVETAGNYNTLGWRLSLDDAEWWVSRNFGSEQPDLYSIVHHELGHTLAFSTAYPKEAAAHAAGGDVSSPEILAYHKSALHMDGFDHFPAQLDDPSARGLFGNEYGSQVTLGRWFPTSLDVLAAQALGYVPSDADLVARAEAGGRFVVTATFP
jgi:hypothetical protein